MADFLSVQKQGYRTALTSSESRGRSSRSSGSQPSVQNQVLAAATALTRALICFEAINSGENKTAFLFIQDCFSNIVCCVKFHGLMAPMDQFFFSSLLGELSLHCQTFGSQAVFEFDSFIYNAFDLSSFLLFFKIRNVSYFFKNSKKSVWTLKPPSNCRKLLISSIMIGSHR